jgi:hypothetical protein
MSKGFAHYRYRPLFLLIIAALCTPAFAGAAEIRDNQPFLSSSINNNHPFAGQEVLLTYRLYFRDAAPKISDETGPSLPGLWSRERSLERFIKSAPENVQGKPFRSAVVKQFKLVPIQSGTITISGYSMLCVLPQENIGTDGKELPETRLRITAPALTISARALPEPVPEKLSGAVGTFSLNLIADKQTLKIGEPLSLKLILTGTGSLLTLELPILQLPDSFRHNPPERTTTLTSESETTSGTITSTMVAWPQAEGNFHIPAAALAVFNPETKQFSTLYTKPLTITVAPAAREATVSTEEPLHRATEQTGSVRPLFIAIALLVVMTGAAMLLVRKKRLTDAKNVQAEQTTIPPESRKAARIMKEQLFSLLEEAGIKSPGGMTRIELNDAMQAFNIPDETRSELTTALDSLDKILYSPSGGKESRIPDRIAAKFHDLLHALKKAGPLR